MTCYVYYLLIIYTESIKFTKLSKIKTKLKKKLINQTHKK